MMKKMTYHSNNWTQEKLQLLGNEIVENWDSIIEHFDFNMRVDGKKFVGCCPVHGGDNSNAFNLFHIGDSLVGNWKCRTHECESEFVNTPIGLIRGILSHQKFNWEGRGDETVSFMEAVNWCNSFIGKDFDNYVVDNKVIDMTRFASQVQNIYARERPKGIMPREKIKGILEIPAKYYNDRGYNKETLIKYDVGLCTNPNKEMYQRVVVPIYDDEHKFMVGCTGRSTWPQCAHCKLWHQYGHKCPNKNNFWNCSKWKHSKGFKGEEFLYNYWFAKKYIQEIGAAVLVESPGNVWRLEEAGIHNSVGIFGTSLSSGQKALLDSSGAMTLIILTDRDEAGKLAADKIKIQCETMYNVIIPSFDFAMVNDVGDMTIEQVQQLFSNIKMNKYEI